MSINNLSLQSLSYAPDFQGDLRSNCAEFRSWAYRQPVFANLIPETEIAHGRTKRAYPIMGNFGGKYRSGMRHIQPDVEMPVLSVQQFGIAISYTDDVVRFTDRDMISPLMEQGAQAMAIERDKIAIGVIPQADQSYGGAGLNLSKLSSLRLDNIIHQGDDWSGILQFDTSLGEMYLVMNGAVYSNNLVNALNFETINVRGQRFQGYRSFWGTHYLRDDNIPITGTGENAESTGLMFAQNAVQAAHANLIDPILSKYDGETGVTKITMQDWYGAIVVNQQSVCSVTASAQRLS